MTALVVLPMFAVLVAPPVGPDDACPSARQVSDAMQARFPAWLVSADQSQSPPQPRLDVLRAVLDVAGDGTVVRFSLVDGRGETQLRRALPAPGRGRPVADCLALADTLAAIVERYLGTISYETPESDLPAVPTRAPEANIVTPNPVPVPTPAPAPLPRSAFLMLGVAWRMAENGQIEHGGIEGRLTAEVELTRAVPRMAGLISVAASRGVEADLRNLGEPRTATLRRFPFRLGAVLALPAGPGFVEPATELGVDVLSVSSTAALPRFPASQSFRFAPIVEASVGYRVKIAGPFHLRPRVSIGLALKRYEVGVEDTEDTVFVTPRAYASFGIDMGVLFR